MCYYFHNHKAAYETRILMYKSNGSQALPCSCFAPKRMARQSVLHGASSRWEPQADQGVSQLRARPVAKHLTNIRTLSAKSYYLFLSRVAALPNLWYISIKESHRIFHICVFHKEWTPNIDTKYIQNHQHIPWSVVRMLYSIMASKDYH